MNARSEVHENRLLGVSLTAAEAALAESLPVVLHTPTYDALFALGVSGRAVTGEDQFDGLHVEPVVYLDGDRFELARDMCDQSGARLAVIIPCRNDLGFADNIAAWEIETGRLSAWRGAAALIGESYLAEPWVEDGVRVFSDALQWLLSGRRGVVILRAELARWRLAEFRLIVSDVAFGRRLRDALRLPAPHIFVDGARAVA